LTFDDDTLYFFNVHVSVLCLLLFSSFILCKKVAISWNRRCTSSEICTSRVLTDCAFCIVCCCSDMSHDLTELLLCIHKTGVQIPVKIVIPLLSTACKPALGPTYPSYPSVPTLI